MLIHGLLILLRRSVQPSAAQKRVRSLWQLWYKSSMCCSVHKVGLLELPRCEAMSPASPLLARRFFGKQHREPVAL